VVAFLSLTTIGVLPATTFGQAVEPAARKASAQPSNEQIRSTEGPIFRIGAVTGSKLASNDFKGSAKIQDVIMDLDTGHVPFVVLAVEDADGAAAPLVVPTSAIRDFGTREQSLRLTAEELRQSPKVPKAASELTRAWATSVLGHFKTEPYWKADNDRVSDRDVLVRASQLHDVVVLADDGKPLGRIQDFAMTSRGDIAYAGLSRHDKTDQLHPIPLSAFIAPVGNAEWRLNLPPDIVENTPKFAAASWPTTLDRGWLEYVHVRYGRSVFDGVNRTAQPNQAPPQKESK
jgi:hypothetical protein